MYYDGLWVLPGFVQAVEVLVMVKDIAAAPIDEFDVGVEIGSAVEMEQLPR